jgi:hypothetical protein
MNPSLRQGLDECIGALVNGVRETVRHVSRTSQPASTNREVHTAAFLEVRIVAQREYRPALKTEYTVLEGEEYVTSQGSGTKAQSGQVTNR